MEVVIKHTFFSSSSYPVPLSLCLLFSLFPFPHSLHLSLPSRTQALGLSTYDALGEYHGTASRCIPQDPTRAIIQGTEVMQPSGAGCYRVECNDGDLWVHMGTARFRCPTGQYVDLSVATSTSTTPYASGRLGPCPDNATMCRQLSCPADCSGRGICVGGQCSCYAGWLGTTCSEPAHQSLTEVQFDGTVDPPPPGADFPPPPPPPPSPPPPPPVIANNLDLVFEFEFSREALSLLSEQQGGSGVRVPSDFSDAVRERFSAAARVGEDAVSIEEVSIGFRHPTEAPDYSGVDGHPTCQKAPRRVEWEDLGGGDESKVLLLRLRASFKVPNPNESLMVDVERARDAIAMDPLSVFASNYSIFSEVSGIDLYNCRIEVRMLKHFNCPIEARMLLYLSHRPCYRR